MDFLFLRLGATYVPGATSTGGGILPRPHWLRDAKIPLTGLSLWCAYGTTATQLAEKFANQAVASTAQSSKKTTLDRLRKQRDALTFTETSAEAVKTAQGAVSTAAEQAAAERTRVVAGTYAGNGKRRSAPHARPCSRHRRIAPRPSRRPSSMAGLPLPSTP